MKEIEKRQIAVPKLYADDFSYTTVYLDAMMTIDPHRSLPPRDNLNECNSSNDLVQVVHGNHLGRFFKWPKICTSIWWEDFVHIGGLYTQ